MSENVDNLNTEVLDGFTTISEGLKNEIKFANKSYSERVESLNSKVMHLTKKIKSRKSIAMILKLIVVLSGLVIASGFLNDMKVIIQIIGFVVLAITAIENIFANLDRLLSNVAASNAYSSISRDVRKIHFSRLGPILGLKESDPESAGKQYVELLKELTVKLDDINDEVETNLANKRYELLGRLTLEDD